MQVTGADLYGFQPHSLISRVGGIAHEYRERRILTGAAGVVAELAIPVVSPGVRVSVVAQGQRMPVSGADLYSFQSSALISRAAGVAYAHRNMRIRFRVIAELARAVVSPGVCISVTAQGYRMPASGADLYVGEIRWQVWIRLAIRFLNHDRRISGVFGRPVAKLAIRVVSPGVRVPVAAHSQGE